MSLSNGPPQSDSEQATAGSATAVPGVTSDAGDSSKDGDGSSGMLKVLNDRLHRLELLVESYKRPERSANVEQENRHTARVCWNCGKNDTSHLSAQVVVQNNYI